MPSIEYVVPNGITVAAMVLGLGSIFASTTGDFELAGWMIVWAMLLDKLDGAAARMLQATSKFGAELDSFSDFVSFGIAPAALVRFGLGAMPFWEESMGWLLSATAGAYVVAAALRLAKFNITTYPAGSTHFFGVPTTAVAGIIAGFFVCLGRHDATREALVFMPLLLLVCIILMLGRFPMPKLGRRSNRWVQGLQIVLVVSAYAVAPFRLFPEYLLSVVLILVGAGLVAGMIHPPQETSSDFPSDGLAEMEQIHL